MMIAFQDRARRMLPRSIIFVAAALLASCSSDPGESAVSASAAAVTAGTGAVATGAGTVAATTSPAQRTTSSVTLITGDVVQLAQGTVSLRTHAEDARGNSVTQTVTDVYRTSAAR